MPQDSKLRTSKHICPFGVTRLIANRGLLGDGSGNNSGGGLFGESSGNNSGGGLFGLGFFRDRPDGRDFEAKEFARRLGETLPRKEEYRSLLKTTDLVAETKWFGDVEAQGAVQSCTSHAVTSMAEYYWNQRNEARVQLSRLFLYKLSRELLYIDGDQGSTIRESLKALQKYGCLSEDQWPYSLPWLERLPRIRDLEAAAEFKEIDYFRLDDSDAEQTCFNVLYALENRHPVAFGFTIYDCIDDVHGRKAIIPLPCNDSHALGAHAVLAVGFERRSSKLEEGFLVIRNSWGAGWGDNGYARLPFAYILRRLACDFWVMLPKDS